MIFAVVITMKKYTTNATIRNAITALKKFPIFTTPVPTCTTTALKSGLPTTAAMSGLRTSPTRELMTAVNAAPMMAAIARSITFPRRIKSRNPLIICSSRSCLFALRHYSSEDEREQFSLGGTLAHPTHTWRFEVGNFSPGARFSPIRDEEDNQHQNHEIRIQQDQHSRRIQAPLATHAAPRLPHSPRAKGQRHD